MSKVLIGIAGAALIAVLVVQQKQLETISQDVAEIKQAFITQTTEQVAFTEKDEDCLAKNVYYEAGIESEKGKYAVAQVTVNRLKSGKWGDSICSVVYSKAQFSWTLKKKLEKPSGNAWVDSQWIAHRVLRGGDRVPQLKTAMFYHADYVSPKWRDPVAKIQQVGQHIFYTKAKMKVTNI
jgi:spore germination cell wall hydrolase CwlJ-like protein